MASVAKVSAQLVPLMITFLFESGEGSWSQEDLVLSSIARLPV